MKQTSLIFYVSCLNAKTKHVPNLLKIYLLNVFNLSQLRINYGGPHLLNTIVLNQNTDLEQFTKPKCFKEKLRAYHFEKLLLAYDKVVFSKAWRI